MPHFWLVPTKLSHKLCGWRCCKLIHLLKIPLLQRPPLVCPLVLEGTKQVDNPYRGVSFCELIEGLLLHMKCTWGDKYRDMLLPHWWWCILLVRYYLQKENTGRERIDLPQLRCMLMQYARLHGCAGMRHQDLFSWLGYILKANWVTWMRSCGLSWGVRSRRKKAAWCLLVIGCLQTGQMGLGRSCQGWNIF